MEKVSIIIITYNRPIEILFRAINSAINQDYYNTEIIVVNDAPENIVLSGQIVELISRFDDLRIKYLSYDSNHGSNYARNYGLMNCEGEFVSFLDDDDEWYSNKLSLQVEEIKKNEKIGLVSCAFDISDGKSIINHKNVFPARDSSIDYLLESNYVGGTSFPLLRKAFVDKVGGFDESLKSCQEYELWIRLREISDFSSVPVSLGIYYDSSDSTYKRNPEKYYLGDKTILEKHRDLYRSHLNSYNKHLNGMAFHWLKLKRFKWYIEYKKIAISLRPFSFDNFTILCIFRSVFRRIMK